MKVLFLVRDLGLGGVERCVALVGEGLAARGVDVSVAMLAGNRNLWADRTAALNIVDLSGVWHGKKPWTWLAGWRAVRKLAREHDVIIAATFLAPLYMGYAATRGLSKRFIGWVHGPLAELDAFARMNPVHRTACQFVYRRMQELVFVSQHARESMGRWLGSAVKPGWLVLPNFVDANGIAAFIPPFAEGGVGGISTSPEVSPTFDQCANIAEIPPSPPSRKGGGGHLLFVGRIAEEKQPHLWLDTLAALDKQGIKAELTIVGDGPLEAWLRTEANSRGLSEQLIFAGRQGHVAPYLAQADILLLTSSFEGCPLVVLEAMQAGLPVVSTDAGGVYELFGERRNDFIAAANTGAALADLIAKQLPQHAQLADWLRHRADAYSAAATLDRWLDLLNPSMKSSP